MDYSGEGVSVYAEAKGEYTRQLCQFLSPALQKYFLDLLEIAKEREPDAKRHLVSFQTLLEGISEWNIDKVQRETQALAMSTQCDYLEELLTAVFIAHTKVLSAIRLTNRQKKLQITIPKLEHFLHRTLTECARLLWTNTFLFATSGTSLERQKNMRQIEALITEGVLQGVRSMLPVKSILREYLAGDESDRETATDVEDEEEEEEEEEEETAAPDKPELPVEPEVEPSKLVVPEPTPTHQDPIKTEVPIGPTGASEPAPPVINLTDVATESTFKPLFEQQPLVQSVVPKSEVTTPSHPVISSAQDEIIEMDDIPGEYETSNNSIEEDNEFHDISGPLSAAEDNDTGFEFEEL